MTTAIANYLTFLQNHETHLNDDSKWIQDDAIGVILGHKSGSTKLAEEMLERILTTWTSDIPLEVTAQKESLLPFTSYAA